MGTVATLYLGFDGVLHPNLVSLSRGHLPRLRAGGHVLFENNAILQQVIDTCPQTEVVLHSWWVPLLGYQAALQMLPETVQTHVIGATWRGTRGLRARLRPAGPRRRWLEEDLRLRCPRQPVLLDFDCGQIAPVLTECSCIVDGWYGLASAGASDRLIALLGVCDTKRTPHPTGIAGEAVSAEK